MDGHRMDQIYRENKVIAEHNEHNRRGIMSSVFNHSSFQTGKAEEQKSRPAAVARPRTTGVKEHVVATMRELVGAKNNADLSRILEVDPPVLSKIAHDRLPVGPSILIALHDHTGMQIRDIRARLGVAA